MPITTANEELFNLSVRHAVGIERYKKSQVTKMVRLLENDVIPPLVDRLQVRLARIKSRGFDSGVFTTKRYKEMIKSLDQIVEKGYQKIGKTFISDMMHLADSEVEFALGSINKSVPLQLQFATPGLASIKNVVQKKIMGDVGVDMRTALKGVKTSAKRMVRKQIDVGLLQGDSIDQIVRRIRGARGVENLARNQLASVTRTAVKHTSTATREATFAENSDVIKSVQFVATLDARTTEICGGLDGKVFALDEGPRPPMHHQCRSEIIPVLKSWKELGIDLKKAPAGTRASMDGQVSENLTYGKWLKKQPKETQNEILGVGKAKLFRRGNVKIEQFTDSAHRPLTLKQLTALEKKILN